ncbi:outer membrane protein assembly factor BamB family protein [Gordonia iterans]
MQQTARHHGSRLRAVAAVVLATVTALVLASCADGQEEVRAIPGAGWPMYGADNGNTNYTPVTVPAGLELSWRRPTGGPITAPISLNQYGDVGITARTTNGCNVFVFDHNSGRKNFCKRMTEGVQFNAMTFDQHGQPFLGESGALVAFNGGGMIRWRMPVVGTSLSAKFAGPGRILSVTTQGQLLLLNAQNDAFEAPEVRLRPNADPEDPTFGLGDCIAGGPQCAVTAPAAVDSKRDRFYLNFRAEGAAASQLTAMSYADRDGAREFTGVWNADLPGGMVGPATLSHDGETVYAFGGDGKLYAYAAGDGALRWSHDLGEHGFATLTVSPDGVLIPTGSVGAPLTVLKDDGDSATVIAKREDLQTVSLSTLTGGGSAWTVVRSGPEQKLVLTEVSVTDGATKRSLDLPDATGFATGVAVSAGGDVAVAVNLGEVYYFSAG